MHLFSFRSPPYCVGANAPVPDLETALIECHLPQNVEDKNVKASEELAKVLTSRVKGHDGITADVVRGMAIMFTAFPNLQGYGSVDSNALVAMANRNLIKMAREPIRPKYEPLTVDRQIPPRPLTILIVDDDIGEILKTASSLAGWPDVGVSWIHQKSNLGYSPSLATIENAIVELAQAITARGCDVVFMDQGMRDVEGDKVVAKLIEQGTRMVFVANTGGDGGQLKNAGCVASAEKGGKIGKAMQIVFDCLPE
jgi:CheY-like chemotaxis protein